MAVLDAELDGRLVLAIGDTEAERFQTLPINPVGARKLYAPVALFHDENDEYTLITNYYAASPPFAHEGTKIFAFTYSADTINDMTTTWFEGLTTIQAAESGTTRALLVYQVPGYDPTERAWSLLSFEGGRLRSGRLDAMDEAHCRFAGDIGTVPSFIPISTTGPVGRRSATLTPWIHEQDTHWIVGLGRLNADDASLHEASIFRVADGDGCNDENQRQNIAVLPELHTISELVIVGPPDGVETGRILAVGHTALGQYAGRYSELALSDNGEVVISPEMVNFDANRSRDWTLLKTDASGPIAAWVEDELDAQNGRVQSVIKLSTDSIFPEDIISVLAADRDETVGAPVLKTRYPREQEDPYAFSLFWTTQTHDGLWSTTEKLYESCF